MILSTSFLITVSANSKEQKDCNCPLVAVIHQPVETLAEQLGYCKIPPPKGHGVYYVFENGKCVAKVK
jgi:hypothetical protein